jgi:hypothetical protein
VPQARNPPRSRTLQQPSTSRRDPGCSIVTSCRDGMPVVLPRRCGRMNEGHRAREACVSATTRRPTQHGVNIRQTERNVCANAGDSHRQVRARHRYSTARGRAPFPFRSLVQERHTTGAGSSHHGASYEARPQPIPPENGAQRGPVLRACRHERAAARGRRSCELSVASLDFVRCTPDTRRSAMARGHRVRAGEPFPVAGPIEGPVGCRGRGVPLRAGCPGRPARRVGGVPNADQGGVTVNPSRTGNRRRGQ